MAWRVRPLCELHDPGGRDGSASGDRDPATVDQGGPQAQGHARGLDANCQSPVGTGPFVVKEWIHGQRVELDRNPNYNSAPADAKHQGPAYLDHISWKFLEDGSVRFAAVAGQGADLIFNPPPQQDDTRLDLAKPDIKTIKLADGVYMLEGQGGNIGNITVAAAKDGLIMVDSGRASLHDRIRAAIATISHLKVKYLINTQFRADHAGGNEHFARDGAIVIAEVHVRTRLAAGTIDGLTGSLESGKSADVLIVEGAADRDIRALRRPRLVVAAGRLVQPTPPPAWPGPLEW